MAAYANSGGDSSVESYDDSDPDAIVVTFKSGRWRHYEYRVGAGISRWQLDTMLAFARNGQGLGGFINRVARNAYARKW